MRQNNLLYMLSNGRVAAVDKKSGEIKWEVKLKQYLSRKVGLHIGQISVEDGKIYVGSTGVLLCLSCKDGSLIWKNELKGWGYYFVSMANVGTEAAAASAIDAAAHATVIAAST